MPIAELARRAQEGGVVDLHAGCALHHGLDDERRQRVRILRERALESGDRALQVPRLARRRNADGVRQGGGEWPSEHLETAQRGHAERLAVEGVLQRRKGAPLRATVLRPVLECELQRHFHCGRTVVAVEDVLEAARRGAADRVGQLGGPFVCDTRQRGVAQPIRLLPQRLH